MSQVSFGVPGSFVVWVSNTERVDRLWPVAEVAVEVGGRVWSDRDRDDTTHLGTFSGQVIGWLNAEVTPEVDEAALSVDGAAVLHAEYRDAFHNDRARVDALGVGGVSKLWVGYLFDAVYLLAMCTPSQIRILACDADAVGTSAESPELTRPFEFSECVLSRDTFEELCWHLSRALDALTTRGGTGDPYLDNNATTPLLPEVVDAMNASLRGDWQNPSSVHRGGQKARHAVELARADIANLLKIKPRELVLTSSGTESIDLAIRGSIAATGKNVVVTSDIEHAAVRDLCDALARDGAEIRRLPIVNGVVDAAALSALLAGGDVAVVSVQWANNETGAIMPVERIHEICREHRVAFHCDGTQWVGKLLVPSDGPPCDLLTASAHKFHGPKGVGMLWVRQGIGIRPLMHGSQELGRRGGTENVPGIVGAGVAAKAMAGWLHWPEERRGIAALRDRFEQSVLERCPGAIVNGPREHRLWNTSNIGFPGLEAEALLLAFSERGLAASAGAACSSGSLDPSPVLLAMGIAPNVAHGSVRFSLSRLTTESEIDEAIETVTECVGRFRV